MKYFEILNTEVSFYKNVKDSNPQTKSLNEILFSDEFNAIVNKVRSAKTPEEKKQFKMSAPSFTVSGVFGTGSDNSLIRHSGLICIDLDRKDNADVNNFDDLKSLISSVPFVVFCGLSISGDSYYAIVPIASPDLHREHFESLCKAFKRCGLTVDSSGVNTARKRFISLDPSPYVNQKAETYTHFIKSERQATQKHDKAISKSDLEELEELAGLAVADGTDITGGYRQWLSIAFALANDLGEGGRDLFHSFSSISTDYDEGETDTKYSSAIDAVSAENKIHPHIATVLHFCKASGLTAQNDFTNRV